jgi:hypothetical protein
MFRTKKVEFFHFYLSVGKVLWEQIFPGNLKITSTELKSLSGSYTKYQVWTQQVPQNTAYGKLLNFLDAEIFGLYSIRFICFASVLHFTLHSVVLDEPYSQLIPLSGVAVQARQST